MKRDPCKHKKETDVNTQRDLCVYKSTCVKTKRDLCVRKETYIHEKRPAEEMRILQQKVLFFCFFGDLCV